MSKQQTVSVVIPSWNSESQMKQNLPYVFAAAKAVDAEIIIIDDHSVSDNSVDYLKSLGMKIRLYQNKKNEGYSVSVNRGVSLAGGDLVMLINTDVRPSPDCFVKALKYFEDKSVYALNFNSGEAWMGGEWKDGLFHHFRVEPNDMNKNSVNPSLWASGGQGAFDRAKWLALGGMDLLYKPFYWEDTDMGWSAWKRGWKVLWAPECRVVHDHDSSVITSSFKSEFITATAQRNQFLFIWKNITDRSFMLSHLIRLPYFLIKFPLPVLRAFTYLPIVWSHRRAAGKSWVKEDGEILKIWTR